MLRFLWTLSGIALLLSSILRPVYLLFNTLLSNIFSSLDPNAQTVQAIPTAIIIPVWISVLLAHISPRLTIAFLVGKEEFGMEPTVLYNAKEDNFLTLPRASANAHRLSFGMENSVFLVLLEKFGMQSRGHANVHCLWDGMGMHVLLFPNAQVAKYGMFIHSVANVRNINLREVEDASMYQPVQEDKFWIPQPIDVFVYKTLSGMAFAATILHV